MMFPEKTGNSSAVATPMSKPIALQVLMNDGVLTEIFSYFRVGLGKPCARTDSVNRGILLSAALTCISWRDIALGVLWSSLPSLFPLLDVLKNVEKTTSGPAGSTIGFDRFDICARKVKSLAIGQIAEDRRCQIPSYLFLQLARHYSFQDVLPYLRHLHVHGPTVTSEHEGIFLLLSTGLRSIDFSKATWINSGHSDPNAYLSSLLATATRRSPSISCLSIDTILDRNLGSLEKILKFGTLTSLSIRMCSSEKLQQYGWRVFFLQLSSLAALEYLVVQVSTSNWNMNYIPPYPRPEFSKLRRLHTIGTPSSITNFLQLFTMPTTLQAITVETPNSYLYQTSQHLFHDIVECFSYISKIARLEFLRIDFNLDDLRFPYGNISSAFEMQTMLKVLIITMKGLVITDEDVYYMTRSLPNLTSLHLPNTTSPGDLSISINLQIIPSIPANHLHSLRNLTLFTNTSVGLLLDQKSKWVEIMELMDTYREIRTAPLCSNPFSLSSEIEKILKAMTGTPTSF
ncbi:hypothetical protein BDQ17DRAFT_1346966 [Cyathus striatus]|nr:hypothetical protein BDQ17DRAFT_1346966 [Cyathus striatus]